MSDILYVKVVDKVCGFVQTEKHWWDITNCQPSTYNKAGINLHGVLRNAKQVRPEYIADLLAKERRSVKGKASNIRQFQKEAAV